MASWDIYQGMTGDKSFTVQVTVYVKAQNEKRAWEFVKHKLKPEGGLSYSVEQTDNNKPK